MCNFIVVALLGLSVFVASIVVFNIKTAGVEIIPIVESLDVV